VVGVAVPIIMQFDASISDKASVEKAMKVTTIPPVEGSWACCPTRSADRGCTGGLGTTNPAGTKVNVAAQLYGIPFGDGAFGAQDVTLDFEIGRRQVVKAEASSHQIEGDHRRGTIMTLPCSYGEADQPRNVTRSGVHVVTEKYEDFYMTNPAAGYSNVHERFAVRISNNGEFIHANPSSAGAQGNTNVTNGWHQPVDVRRAAVLQHRDLRRPVEVTGTSIELSYADGDVWDWAISWDEWKAMSAVTPAPSPLNLPSTAPATPTDAPTLSGTPTTTTPTTTAPTTTPTPATTSPGG